MLSLMCRNEGTAHALALLVHGDAAMAGLGIVTEAMQMSELEAYWVRPTLSPLAGLALLVSSRTRSRSDSCPMFNFRASAAPN